MIYLVKEIAFFKSRQGTICPLQAAENLAPLLAFCSLNTEQPKPTMVAQSSKGVMVGIWTSIDVATRLSDYPGLTKGVFTADNGQFGGLVITPLSKKEPMRSLLVALTKDRSAEMSVVLHRLTRQVLQELCDSPDFFVEREGYRSASHVLAEWRILPRSMSKISPPPVQLPARPCCTNAHPCFMSDCASCWTRHCRPCSKKEPCLRFGCEDCEVRLWRKLSIYAKSAQSSPPHFPLKERWSLRAPDDKRTFRAADNPYAWSGGDGKFPAVSIW